MLTKKCILFAALVPAFLCWGQQNPMRHSNYSFIRLQYDFGRTSPANTYFPETKPFEGVQLSVGKTHFSEDSEWVRQLNYPITGCSFSFSNFGNTEKIGRAVSVIPFLDFALFSNRTHKWHANVGVGVSYFDVIYDAVSNATNQAISTRFTWAFRSDVRYDLWQFKQGVSQLTLGYFHNSNGHMRLPNYGLNTFLVGLNTEFHFKPTVDRILPVESPAITGGSGIQTYYSSRFGVGQNVLTKFDNTKREVYTISGAAGKIKNRTFKYGAGFFYRFYESYYDYIKNDGALIIEMYPDLKRQPVLKSSAFGVFGEGELLLNHIGVELQVGFNFYKPAYKVDWKLNQGKIIYDGSYQLGKLNWYYDVKHVVSSRLGLKYYVCSNNKAPAHNIFLGAFINANLGQADFTELALGYVYCPSRRKR